MSLAGRELILGVSGSIAAFKAVYLLRDLQRAGARVSVVMTAAATEFVTPLTFRTLSGRPVLTGLFDPQEAVAVEHVALAERAALAIVAPATAQTLARGALGLADDALGTVLLALRGPALFVPAMDGGMWEHPAVQANVATLRGRGATVMEPDHGDLASGLKGPGRFPEPADVVEAAVRLLWPVHDFVGEHVLVTAGPTREAVDPVRYLSNRSSGRMGYALATQAVRRGARVTLVTGPTRLTPPRGVRVVPVESAEEMRAAVLKAFPEATVVIKAAAVADYRPARPAEAKIRSRQEGLSLSLAPNADILKELSAMKGDRFLVGFAAETGDLLASARTKLRAKGVDLLVGNDVSRRDVGFDVGENEVVLLDDRGGVVEVSRRSKDEVADRILDRVRELRSAPAPAGRP